jgi:hypothetical protein
MTRRNSSRTGWYQLPAAGSVCGTLERMLSRHAPLGNWPRTPSTWQQRTGGRWGSRWLLAPCLRARGVQLPAPDGSHQQQERRGSAAASHVGESRLPSG